ESNHRLLRTTLGQIDVERAALQPQVAGGRHPPHVDARVRTEAQPRAVLDLDFCGALLVSPEQVALADHSVAVQIAPFRATGTLHEQTAGEGPHPARSAALRRYRPQSQHSYHDYRRRQPEKNASHR